MTDPGKQPSSSEQLDALLAAVEALPAEPVGECITDGELIAFVFAELGEDDQRRVELHAKSCDRCGGRLEKLIVSTMAWNGDEGAVRLAAHRERTLAAARAGAESASAGSTVLAALRNLLSALKGQVTPRRLALQLAFADAPFRLEREDEGGVAGVLVKEEPNGDLVLRIDAREPALAGGSVVLWLDDREWTGALRRTGAEWVSAEIRIARADRSTLPVHGELDIDVLPPDGASPSADA